VSSKKIDFCAIMLLHVISLNGGGVYTLLEGLSNTFFVFYVKEGEGVDFLTLFRGYTTSATCTPRWF
jgi:hypothetical protein